MKVIISHKFKYELLEDEIKRLKQLHLKNGLMFGHFKNEDECEVILAIHKGEIIGWGLVFDNVDNEKEFHVYVSKYKRRFGIGTKIFEYASDLYPEDGLLVLKWNEEASAFYNNFDVIENDPED